MKIYVISRLHTEYTIVLVIMAVAMVTRTWHKLVLQIFTDCFVLCREAKRVIMYRTCWPTEQNSGYLINRWCLGSDRAPELRAGRWIHTRMCPIFRSAVHSSNLQLTVNLLKPTGYVMHQQFNIQQLYVLPTLYLCVLYLSGNKQRLVPLTA